MVSLLKARNYRQTHHKEASADPIVFDDVNLASAEGEIVAPLGRSGSGKSTRLRIVIGWQRYAEVFGYDEETEG